MALSLSERNLVPCSGPRGISGDEHAGDGAGPFPRQRRLGPAPPSHAQYGYWLHRLRLGRPNSQVGRHIDTLARTLHLTRSFPRSTYQLPAAHQYAARDMEYNPNKTSCIVTCGEDRLVKFWDLRRTSVPVRALAGHSHWLVLTQAPTRMQVSRTFGPSSVEVLRATAKLLGQGHLCEI